MTDNAPDNYQIDRDSKEARKIDHFLQNPSDRNLPESMHFVISQYP